MENLGLALEATDWGNIAVGLALMATLFGTYRNVRQLFGFHANVRARYQASNL